ncbi:MAG: glycogen/starch/alpha-glucan phosphorylase [Fibrobacterota bacterium]
MSREKVRKVQDEIYKGMTAEAVKMSFRNNLKYRQAKDKYSATDYDRYLSIANTVMDRMVDRWLHTQREYHKKNVKRVYYLSMEFLIGRSLGNSLINLGIFNECAEALQELGLDLEEIREEEYDAGLGNGGLGRLAACFLDSMATLGIPAHGYGIRYDYGIFRQKIVDGYQVEYPDEWLRNGNPWELPRPESSMTIKFYGRSEQYNDPSGRKRFRWVDTEDIIALPYDTPIPGYKNNTVNNLRLWSARATKEFKLDYFNHGNYMEACESKVRTEVISKVLYPNDMVQEGKELRLKQQYFFVSASIQDIIRRFLIHNPDIEKLPEKIAIQLNDTHPSIAVAEFMHILHDQRGLNWEKAWEITTKTLAYTNHTILPEALEKWPVSLFSKMFPRHMEIIYEINKIFLRQVANKYPGDVGKLRHMSLIEEGADPMIRMSYLAIIGSHSVNGVAALHSEILKKYVFREFYELWPEKFNNKTNGITPRRWLRKANPRLSKLIESKIGDNWILDLSDLRKLSDFSKNPEYQKLWMGVKRENKREFSAYLKEAFDFDVNPDSMFDVQIKRMHEYKRQLMCALHALVLYSRIKKNGRDSIVPRTIFFAGKSAPGYATAKLIIKFINSVAEVINNDSETNDILKVFFLENYRVSLAEKIFPASDLSEQISTAGLEASGTGNMKFALNGALTIGTLDGANIEIKEEVGDDHIFIFGKTSEEIEEMRGNYNPGEYIDKSPELKQVLELINTNFFNPEKPGLFKSLIDSIYKEDRYFIAADFNSYLNAQKEAEKRYADKSGWAASSIMNVAGSGKFSSDRTIKEYADGIWGVEPEKFEDVDDEGDY